MFFFHGVVILLDYFETLESKLDFNHIYLLLFFLKRESIRNFNEYMNNVYYTHIHPYDNEDVIISNLLVFEVSILFYWNTCFSAVGESLLKIAPRQTCYDGIKRMQQ